MSKTPIYCAIAVAILITPVICVGQTPLDANPVIYSDKVEFLGAPLFQLVDNKSNFDKYLAPIAGIAGTVVGVLITTILKYIDKRTGRKEEEALVATALLDEIANRAARCAFDYDSIWHQYVPNCAPYNLRDLQKILKFRPNPPVIYPAMASKVSLLNLDTRTAVTSFYTKLEEWRREIEDTHRLYFNSNTPNEKVSVGVHFRLSRRLAETLEPAKSAISKVEKYVPEASQIVERSFRSLYANSLIDGMTTTLENETPIQIFDRLIRYSRHARVAEQQQNNDQIS